MALSERAIIDISCGAGHCMAIDAYGVAFSWGASADYQTGHYIEPKKGNGDTQ